MVECLYCESSETWEDETIDGLNDEIEKKIDAALEAAGLDMAVERAWETKHGCQECGALFTVGEITLTTNKVTKEGDKDRRII
jgi:hypothetical protein